MTKKTKKELESIAKFYGAKLTWIVGDWGFYIPGSNKIHVGGTGNDRIVKSIFFHELGHFMNFVNQKYPRYHSSTTWTRKFKTKRGAARYALRAELYTEKVGRRLMKQWYPKEKYKQNYRDNRFWFEFLYNKMFGTRSGIIFIKKVKIKYLFS